MNLDADSIVLIVYLATILLFGVGFARRNENAEHFMTANRSLPGWAVGLSMFGSYISSISFLANPGKAYQSNWNAFAFALSTPLAAAIAARWFVPFYRHSSAVSAYEHLENRFGPWARTYATACFLLMQTVRTGTVMYLLALAVQPLAGWNVYLTISLTGLVVIVFTFLGGITAVVWIGVLQSLVLMSGVLISLATIAVKLDLNIGHSLTAAYDQGKLSLGDYHLTLSQPSFWEVFLFGIVTHLANFGIDQSYIQRYLTASSDREARKSVWLTALLYAPVSGIFFLIGTGLYLFYHLAPDAAALALPPDSVFPHFIAAEIPTIASGLVVAAIFAASMDSNLNSMATLTLCDIYKRHFRPQAGEIESLRVLRIATLGWGLLSIVVAFAMIKAASVLDVWWQLSGLLTGGVLGLFLLALMIRRLRASGAKWALLLGTAVIACVGIPPLLNLPAGWRLPIRVHFTMVLGTLTILIAGFFFSLIQPQTRSSSSNLI